MVAASRTGLAGAHAIDLSSDVMPVQVTKLIASIRVDRRSFVEMLKTLLFIGIAVSVVVFFYERVEYRWQWYRVGRYLIDRRGDVAKPGLLLQGAAVTLKISGVSLVAAASIGLATAMMRLSRSFTANLVAQLYLEAVRNTPLLIQLFFVYFVLSPIFRFSPFVSAVAALSMFEGAYASEIIRGAILGVPRGQWEAAHSLGLTTVDAYRYIVLPQAIRNILPPLAGQAVSLIKDSALVSTIAIYDLTMQGNAIVSETFLTFEIWFVVAAIYLVMTGSLSLSVHLLERRLRRFA